MNFKNLKNLKDKGLLIFWVVVIAVIAGLLIYTQIRSKNITPVKPDTDLLFYSTTCPHCIKVDEFLKANNADTKIAYQKLEVDFSQTNKDLLVAKQTACGYTAENNLGAIPFLSTKDGICFLGDVDIINYFKTKLGL
jgi:glutaredoxin-related protein